MDGLGGQEFPKRLSLLAYMAHDGWVFRILKVHRLAGALTWPNTVCLLNYFIALMEEAI